MPTQALSERPPKVALAVKFFYVIVGIGVIRAVMTIIRHADVRSPVSLIITKLVIYAGSLYLIYQLGKGKNWARWSMVAIFIINIPLTILPAFGSFSHNPIHASLGFVQLALYITALAYLFQKISSSWFNPQKSSVASEQ
jgi:hypothetical protein